MRCAWFCTKDGDNANNGKGNSDGSSGCVNRIVFTSNHNDNKIPGTNTASVVVTIIVVVIYN